MPAAATLTATIRFQTSPSFGPNLILGDASSPLGTGVLSDATSTPVDITNMLNTVAIRRGRNRVLDRFEAGTCTIELTDTTGIFDPDNGTYANEILPMRQLQIQATYGATVYTLYSGFIDEWDYTYRPGETAAFMTVRAVDSFRLLNLSNIGTVTDSGAGQSTSTRLGKILDMITWPSSLRDFSTGAAQTTVQADTGGTRDVLSACQQVSQTELGAFYCETNGVLKFLDRSAIIAKHAETPIEFDDTGANIQYQAVDFDIDDTVLANDVTVTRNSGTAQNVTDTTSITNFFERDYNRTGLIMQTDADALNQANSILGSRKDPKLRVGSIALDAYANVSNRVTAALNTKIFDPIKVTRTQPGGGTVSRTLSVQGIEHNITPSNWVTTFQTAEKILDGFVLDSSTSGILGTNALSY
tara:strand:- start:2195 stop:3436 length:1242 start_codon:yes stop_codon:yes gene_type:complete